MNIKLVKSYLIITFGLILFATGLMAFIIPAGVVSGGISGIATYIYFLTGFPIGFSNLIMNGILLLIGFKILGRGFGVKTIYGILALSFLMTIFQFIVSEPIIEDLFMSIVIGASMMGGGLGIIFTQSGTAGGLDVVVMIVNKYKSISPGKLLIIFDFFIISSSWFLHGSIEKIVYGIVTMVIMAYVIDLILVGAQQSLQVMIFSKERSKEIADRIFSEVDRGVTILSGRGWYSKEDLDVVLVVVRKLEIQLVYKVIKDIDPDCFISVANVMGVYGNGFDKIKI
ncbi:MAG: membrane protein [Candidatus Cloacimonadota bacterium]|nr:MAG: membrane protein [Candidatus Cloacimonadota bacterium]PIE77974.1 MAG: membrane protein [Candidatus Delongbacteria bacterium]